MAKSKSPDAQPAKKVSKSISILASLSKAGAARVKKMAQSPKMWFYLLLGCAIASCLINDTPEGLSLGLLYLMPDGEAKSGRTGSVVYMRNGRRRNFVVPALVQNSFTTSVRASFSTLSSAFKALTQEQIAAWNNTSGYFKSDRFGRSKEVKGKALFVMLNQNLFSIGASLINDPPAAGAVIGLSEAVITAGVDPSTVEISWSSGPTSADTTHMIFATAALSPGISKPGNSEFRQIGVMNNSQASPLDVSAMYTNKFGDTIDGTKVFVKLVPVTTLTGQAGAAIVGGTVATA